MCSYEIVNSVDGYFSALNNGRIYPMVIKAVERKLIEEALESAKGNRIAASKILGIHRNTMHAKIKKLNIDVERYKI